MSRGGRGARQPGYLPGSLALMAIVNGLSLRNLLSDALIVERSGSVPGKPSLASTRARLG